MSISFAELDGLAISRDEGAQSDYSDEDGGYSLMMNLFLYDGYTCSIDGMYGRVYVAFSVW